LFSSTLWTNINLSTTSTSFITYECNNQLPHIYNKCQLILHYKFATADV
jgi:hypothetical protein